MTSMTEHRHADAVARAAMGATYYVWGSNDSGFFGLIKEVLALRGAAADVPPGASAELLRDARLRLVKERTGIEEVGPQDKDRQREVGLRELRGVLPVLAALPPDQADQVRTWLIGIAEHVAAAATDRGGGAVVSDAERAALAEIGGVLGMADPVPDDTVTRG